MLSDIKNENKGLNPKKKLLPVSKILKGLMQKQINEHVKKQIISLFMWIQKGFQYAVCFTVSYRTLEKNP